MIKRMRFSSSFSPRSDNLREMTPSQKALLFSARLAGRKKFFSIIRATICKSALYQSRARSFKALFHFLIMTPPQSRNYYSLFISEETEAQRE